MTASKLKDLRPLLDEIYHRVHELYPANVTREDSDKQLRNRLLVVDLSMHLAQAVVDDASNGAIAEKAANLLYALRLVSPDQPFTDAAKSLLGELP